MTSLIDDVTPHYLEGPDLQEPLVVELNNRLGVGPDHDQATPVLGEEPGEELHEHLRV